MKNNNVLNNVNYWVDYLSQFRIEELTNEDIAEQIVAAIEYTKKEAKADNLESLNHKPDAPDLMPDDVESTFTVDKELEGKERTVNEFGLVYLKKCEKMINKLITQGYILRHRSKIEINGKRYSSYKFKMNCKKIKGSKLDDDKWHKREFNLSNLSPTSLHVLDYVFGEAKDNKNQ